MASKFHNVNGLLLIGMDYHFGIHWPTPIPWPMWFWEVNIVHPFWMGGNQKPSVQIMGVNSVVDGHNPQLLWPHLPVIPDPLNILFPLDLLFGSQKCWLPRTTVYIENEWAAPTVLPCCLSINLDCWSVGQVPSSLILQLGTVETTPSWQDYLIGVVRAAVNLAISAALFFLTYRAPNPARGGIMGWNRVGDAFRYVMRDSPAGQRARTTMANKLGQHFVSRINPFTRSSIGPAVLRTVGIDVGDVVGRAVTGQPQKPTASFGDMATNAVKGSIPGSGAAEGIYQHWFQ